MADELSLPFDQIYERDDLSQSISFLCGHQKGLTSDPIKYFAAPENQDLGIVKRQRKPFIKLIVAPFPEKQRGTPEFFFQAPFCIGIYNLSVK